MQIEDFIKHGPHCLAGKYSAMGRCSCGASAALQELAALREAAQHRVQADLAYCSCQQPTFHKLITACDDCGLPIRQTANA
jgi:hypothetical protein